MLYLTQLHSNAALYDPYALENLVFYLIGFMELAQSPAVSVWVLKEAACTDL